MHITLNNKSLFAAQIFNTPSSRIPHMNEANTNSPLKNVSFAPKSRTNYNDTLKTTELAVQISIGKGVINSKLAERVFIPPLG